MQLRILGQLNRASIKLLLVSESIGCTWRVGDSFGKSEPVVTSGSSSSSTKFHIRIRARPGL